MNRVAHFQKCVAALCIGLFCCIQAYGQDFEKQQIYACVIDTNAIPVIYPDSISIIYPELKQIFENYDLYAFDLAFPVVQSIPVKNKYLLDRVYLLKFSTGGATSFIADINKVNDGYYHYLEMIPIISFIDNQPYTPNDYYIPRDWYNIGDDYALDIIKAREAWTEMTNTYSSNIIIGIPDGGFQMDHVDLENKIQLELNQGVTPYDPIHGTFVAGLAGGHTGNSRGKSSISLNCHLMTYSLTAPLSATDAFNAILKLANNGARVINVSWIYCWYTESISGSGADNTHKRLINMVTDMGALVVAGAGNGKTDYCGPDGNGYAFPASFDRVVSVTSTGPDDSHNNYYVPGEIHAHNDKVDVCAPGYWVMSTWYDTQCDSLLHFSTGTSFASPIVAGLAGLVLTEKPCLAPEAVKYIIESTTDDIYDIDTNQYLEGLLGTGRINAHKAILKVKTFDGLQAMNYTVSQDEIWENAKLVSERLVVKTGATLTIRGDVHFQKDAWAIVEPGAIMIVDGGVMMNEYCGEYWNGIQVWGNVNQSQEAPGVQGKLVLQNNAVIKNAHTGITVAALEKDQNTGEYYVLDNTTGGIVQASDSRILNTVTGVDFQPYHYYDQSEQSYVENTSYFRNVTFINTPFLDKFNLTPEAHAKLNSVIGIKFEGCLFENTTPVLKEGFYDFNSKRGTGIKAYNASFFVMPFKTDKTYISEFKSLFKGIDVEGKTLDLTIGIYHSEFDTVYHGIDVKDIETVEIKNNIFTIYTDWFMNEGEAYGVRLEDCDEFVIADNFFSRIMTTNNDMKLGVIIKNCPGLKNRIQDNIFTHLETGIAADGNNRDVNKDGIQILCNEFENTETCIYVLSCINPTPECGIDETQGENNAPAYNKFSDDIDHGIVNNTQAPLYYYLPARGFPQEYLPVNTVDVSFRNSIYFYPQMMNCTDKADLRDRAEKNGN